MAYPPRKLREFLVLLMLTAIAASPAYARRIRSNTTSPTSEPQSQVPVQPVPSQPATMPNPYNGGMPNGGQPNGYVPSSTPPDPRIQTQQPLRPQQYPAPGANPHQSAGAQAAQPAQTTRTYAAADQYPPKPPRVSFRNGQLSISADNSTLPDILSAIHQRTGAAMELPTTISSERVAVKLGPATTGEVMAALLNGSHFDYIVLNRPEDPSSPERIILREKVATDPNAPNGGGNGYNNGYVASVQPPTYQPPDVQEVPETVPDEEAQPQPEAAVPVPPAGEENTTSPKTPEQLLEELRQMQQQRGQPPQSMTPPQPPLVDNGQPQ